MSGKLNNRGRRGRGVIGDHLRLYLVAYFKLVGLKSLLSRGGWSGEVGGIEKKDQPKESGLFGSAKLVCKFRSGFNIATKRQLTPQRETL